eukprot:CAMPEP_0176494750 /NCGR_PEP_ID=MMETSP0200_2-20121128/10280_1 /TAXON_ID=947934 /ORGANISM="Chaetoceros sp., Strain GSL56" /LENGTH=593 /DNA_ID=CAMNT_0017892563 /DNA_START=52 /DNA_END=1833 /DNA_ORIENTATION=+
MNKSLNNDFFQHQPFRILVRNVNNTTVPVTIETYGLYNETAVTSNHVDPSELMTTANIYQAILSSPIMPLLLSIGLYLLATILTYIEYRNTFHPPLDKRHQGSHPSRANSASPNPRGEHEPSSSGTNNRSRRFPVPLMSSGANASSSTNLNIATGATKYGTSDGTSNPYFYSRDNSSSPHFQGGSITSSPSFRTRGELHRRRFYRFLLYSLILRTICLPLGYFFFEGKEQITSIVSWTLPTLASALASFMLVLFLAHVVATLNGRHDWGHGLFQQYLSQGLYSIYATIVALNCVIPVLTGRILLLTLWGILCGVYLGLFVGMVTYTVLVMNLLRGSIPWPVGSRLVALSLVCSLAFVLRSILYGYETYKGIVGKKTEWVSNQVFGDEMTFYRTVVGYLVLELLPVLIVLSLMHRRKTTHPADAVDSQMAGYGTDAQVAIMQMEAGTFTGLSTGTTLSPVLDSTQEPRTRNLTDGFVGGSSGGSGIGGSTATSVGGVRRSFSENGGVAAPFVAKSARGSVSHSQPLQGTHINPLGGQSLKMTGGTTAVRSSDNMSRSTSGGASRQHSETVSLISSKTESVQGSSSLSYGTVSSS